MIRLLFIFLLFTGFSLGEIENVDTLDKSEKNCIVEVLISDKLDVSVEGEGRYRGSVDLLVQTKDGKYLIQHEEKGSISWSGEPVVTVKMKMKELR